MDDAGDTLLSQNVRRALIAVVAVLLLASIAGTLYVATTDFETGERYTEFYILGEDETAAGYPTNLTTGERGTVLVGIVNHENERMTYRMEVKWNDSVTQSQDVVVAADERTEFPVTVTAPESPGSYQLRFHLYRTTDSVEPYKEVYLYVSVR